MTKGITGSSHGGQAKGTDLAQGLLDTLRARRELLHISRNSLIEQLTSRNKFHFNSLINWELGHMAPGLEHFVAWADALGLEVRLDEKINEKQIHKKEDSRCTE